MNGLNKDDIFRMAKIAWGEHHELFWMNGTDDALKRFAVLVAAAEREACAKVCDLEIVDDEYDVGAKMAQYLAKAIRARGNDAA